MRTSLYSLIAAMLFMSCNSSSTKDDESIAASQALITKDTTYLLKHYWELSDAEKPSIKDVPYDEEGIHIQPGIVFISDSVMAENPKGIITYGTYSLEDSVFQVVFDDGGKAVYHIDKYNKENLWLIRKEDNQTTLLKYVASHTYWPDAKNNPFSKENYHWIKKPSAPETTDELKQRVKGCVQFYADYFNGFVYGHAQTINFGSLPNCFNWYPGGIFIQSEKKLDKKWINCFYSLEQAYEARGLLKEALSKKYDWDTTQANWLKQTALVLKQIHEQL